ncbi:4-nitrophenylphosphatase [Acromyrmex echinatior]|uniref:4-nitrophenylphosphatase n=1 Tax=Acromyrmex echinatior TaxID=103372 RepID=F4X3Q6_ACREC|nr:4-nitrophenylphosphatase [Acromyrmex echinatior]
MSKTKDITKLSTEQLQKFLTSFDIVMCDIDGVLWQLNKPIEGASESLKTLQKLGKQIYLITNNSSKTSDNFYKSPQCINLNLSSDHIVNPIKSIIWYLKKIDFRDEAFAIVSSACRKNFKEAGIRLTEQPNVSETNPSATVKEVLDRPSVKAVIVDFDVNWNWSMLALAISCLERKDVLYIAGPTDEWFQIQAFPQIKIIGPGPLLNVISAQSGRQPILCAKPSQILKDYILDKCNVTNLKRCLFIGDTSLKFDAPIRLLERSCDPLIEEPNIIRKNWVDYCNIYSIRSDERPEPFADLTRCVLMTQVTLYKLLQEAKNTYNSYVIRPNIVVSTPNSTVPFSEEDWEWVKIRNTIIKIMKPVPKYHIAIPYSSRTLKYHLFSNEDNTANSGVYCAPIVSGDIEKDDDYDFMVVNRTFELTATIWMALGTTFLLAGKNCCARVHLLYFHHGSQKPYQIRKSE